MQQTMAESGMAKILRFRLVAALALYMTSLVLPGLYLVDYDPVMGIQILLTGWYGFLILEFAWAANVFFIAAVIAALRKKSLGAAWLATTAFAVGLLSLRSKQWIANHAHIDYLGSGFYVWMTAFALLAITSFAARNERLPTANT